MFAFSGEHEHNLDAKGRLIIPVKFRAPLADGYFLTRGLDGCLWLLPRDTWQGFVAQLQQSSVTQGGARRLDRMLFSGTEDALDSQGRLTIPPPLRGHAELSPNGPVVVVGVKNRIELWEPGRWAAMASEAAQDSEFAEHLGGLGI